MEKSENLLKWSTHISEMVADDANTLTAAAIRNMKSLREFRTSFNNIFSSWDKEMEEKVNGKE